MIFPFAPLPDRDLDDLKKRLVATRRPTLPQGVGWDRGTDAEFLSKLLEFWQDRYDWRTHESRILGLPWQEVGFGDRALRVLHKRASIASAPVVVLLHGWPDSVLRFEKVMPLLSDIHVVIPALPGFPFAFELTRPGMTVKVMASLIAEAMQTLGYDRYVVSAGDVGGDVAEQLSAMHPERIAALHLTNISPLHAVFADRKGLDAEDLEYLDKVATWQRKEGGYIAEQSTKPTTLAPALADSPSGLAAWIVEKLHGWADIAFSEEDLLTWVSIYWFTGTIGTSFAPYVEFAPPVPYVHTPTVLSVFTRDTKPVPHGFALRFINVQEYIEHEKGGHFAAWEKPEYYVEDLRRAIAMGLLRL